MKTQTISITTRADRDRVFQHLSDLEHWRVWATATCGKLLDDAPYSKVHTPVGELFASLHSDPNTGVVDLLLGEQLDEMTLFPIRVMRLPHGSAVTLTCFQPANMPHENFERLYRGFISDFRQLMRMLGGGELHGDAEARPVFFPSLVTGKFYESWDFYTSVLGFRTIKECDVYVHLAHSSGVEFGLVMQEVDGVPAELVTPTDGRGFWLSVTVSDADAEFDRVSQLGLDIVEPLEDKPWGERQFSVRDPNGVIINIAHRTALKMVPDETSVLAV